MSLTDTQLHRLGQLWTDAGAAVSRAWEPGLPADAAQAAAGEHPPLALPQELLTWWGWHNGAKSDSVASISMAHSRFHYSLQDALDHYAIRMRAGHPTPYLLSITSEWTAILVECTPESPTLGRVFTQAHSEDPQLRLGSVAELVDIWIGFLETGVWTYDQSGTPTPGGAQPLPEHASFV